MFTPAIASLAPGLTAVIWLVAAPVLVISLLIPVVVAVALCGSRERGLRARNVLRDLLTALRALLRGGKQ
ncbi:hypothetical protein [Nocardia tengchongensis]|uniref:hypothetical protein n=1 Tax=Nocardia tengchongensis TaxID=2055889 RepID=UPI00367CABF6